MYPVSSQQTGALAVAHNSGSRMSDEDEGTAGMMDVFEGAENNFT